MNYYYPYLEGVLDRLEKVEDYIANVSHNDEEANAINKEVHRYIKDIISDVKDIEQGLSNGNEVAVQ